MNWTEVEAQMRGYLPGVLPSGWSRLADRIVHRDDGVAVAAFSGFGLVVMVESHGVGLHQREHRVVVRRKDGLSTEDLLHVVRLYHRSKLRHALFEMAQDHPGVGHDEATFAFVT